MVITLAATTGRPSGGQVVLPVQQVLRLRDVCFCLTAKDFKTEDLLANSSFEIRTHAISLQFACIYSNMLIQYISSSSFYSSSAARFTLLNCSDFRL
jgi:hypothetical protein